ncbi:hypothetical protein [Micromonospora sp. NPDC048169]|uniref:hypothetical protein n=1 Tax=Micromonospora sp. NPDC048169 TaxID=3154711 RepID=UPI0033F17DAC
MSDIIEAYTDADLAYRIVLLKTLCDLVIDEFKAAKQIAGDQFPKGAAIPARTGDDVKLGKVSKSDPKPVAEVVDRAAVEDYIRTEYADKLESRVELGDIAQIIPILLDADRADLFTEVEVIPDYLYGLARAAAVKGMAVPGVEVKSPPGVVSARSEVAAQQEVRRLLSGARVPLLRELEA